MTIKVLPATLQLERVIVENTTIEELTTFIVKYEAIAQMVSIQLGISSARTEELAQQLFDAKDVIEEGYGKLRQHLINTATRQRHT